MVEIVVGVDGSASAAAALQWAARAAGDQDAWLTAVLACPLVVLPAEEETDG